MPAFRKLRELNPQMLIAWDGGRICAIEDHTDPDGRMFRLEYETTADGAKAIAWCRHNPWSPGAPVLEPHTTNGGLICVGPAAHTTDVNASRHDLEFVVPRARFWCIGVSVFHETGQFPE